MFKWKAGKEIVSYYLNERGWGGSTYSDMVSLFQFVKQLHHGHRHIEICCYFKILKDKIYKKRSEQN